MDTFFLPDTFFGGFFLEKRSFHLREQYCPPPHSPQRCPEKEKKVSIKKNSKKMEKIFFQKTKKVLVSRAKMFFVFSKKNIFANKKRSL
jgi:hypothetical protein